MPSLAGSVPKPLKVPTVMTAEYRQKKAEIGGSSRLKCHRFLALSTVKVSCCQTNTILKCHKFYYLVIKVSREQLMIWTEMFVEEFNNKERLGITNIIIP